MSGTTVHESTTESGAANLDCTLPDDPRPDSFGCSLTVEAPGYATERRHLDRDLFFNEAGGLQRASVDVQLEAVHRIEGRVLDAAGAGIVGAGVALAQIELGTDTLRKLGFAKADSDGRYILETREWVEGPLTLFASAQGYLPGSASTSLLQRGVHSQDPIVLSSGLRLEGSVVGLPLDSPCQFSVQATLEEPIGVPLMDGELGNFDRVGSRLRMRTASVDVRADGSFVISGLEPVEYAVSLAASCPVLQGIIQARWITPPASEISFSISAAIHVIEVIDAVSGDELDLARLQVHVPQIEVPFNFGKRSAPGLVVPPYTAISATLAADGYQSAAVFLPGLGMQEVHKSRWALTKLSPRPPCVLAITDPTSQPVRAVEIEIRPVGAGTSGFITRVLSEVSTGLHPLPLLPSGQYEVRVHPGSQAGWWESSLLSASLVIAIDEREQTIQVRLEPGGFAAVAVSDAEGRPLKARLIVAPISGPVFETVSWFVRGPPASIWNDMVPAGHEARTLRALAPGRYRITASAEAHLTQEREVAIRAGSTERVTFQLAPSDREKK